MHEIQRKPKMKKTFIRLLLTSLVYKWPSKSNISQSNDSNGHHFLFDYSPVCPDDMDWSTHYPELLGYSTETSSATNNNDRPRVEFADIGCGYGGLLGRNDNECIVN